jgi:serine/threonine-protein kinase
VDAVITRCLEKRREDRFPRIEHAFEALLAALRPGPPGPRPVRAVGVHVQVVLANPAQADDEAALDAIEAAMSAAEATLAEAGFEPALRTGSGLFALHARAGDDEVFAGDRDGRLAGLRAALAVETRNPGDFSVHVLVGVHVDEAHLAPGRDRAWAGGRLFCLGEWIPDPALAPGVYATTAALSGLDERLVLEPHPARPGPSRVLALLRAGG